MLADALRTSAPEQVIEIRPVPPGFGDHLQVGFAMGAKG